MQMREGVRGREGEEERERENESAHVRHETDRQTHARTTHLAQTQSDTQTDRQTDRHLIDKNGQVALSLRVCMYDRYTAQ